MPVHSYHHPTTPDTQRGYWPGGQIKFIDNGILRSDYLYNSRKLLTSETQTIAGQSRIRGKSLG